MSKSLRAGLLLAVALLVADAVALAQQDDSAWRNAMQEAAKARQGGRMDEVEKLLNGALAEAEKFGAHDFHVVLSLDALGTFYYQQGNLAQALPVLNRLLEIRERTLGPDHPIVANSLNDVAMVESMQDKHAEAAAKSERALQIAERASATLKGVKMLAAGGNHTCAVMEGGQVKCWGANLDGQLGIPGTISTFAPVAVPGAANAVAVATGSAFSCALLAEGTVNCWGANAAGQTGAAPRPVAEPAPVKGISTARVISAGTEHACALLASGTVKCWGNNQQGQLGNGTTANSPAPVDVTGVTGAKAIAAGGNHACALLSDGDVYCWGSIQAGQAGKEEPARTPVRVEGLPSAATALVAGANHTCALLGGGTVACWGRNQSGQVGIAPSAAVPAPTLVKDLALVENLAAGFSHTCARLGDGTAKCWGNNQEGQLGDGKTAHSPSPAAVLGLGNVVSLAAGVTHTCAVLADTSFRCWGTDSYGAPKGVVFSLRSHQPTTVGRELTLPLNALNTLAGIYRAAGDFAKAEPLYQRAVSMAEKIYGAENPNLAPTLNGYAEMLRKAGRLKEAAQLEERAQWIQNKPALIDVPTAPPPPR